MAKTGVVYLNIEQRKKLDIAFRNKKIRKYSVATAGVLIFLSFCILFLFMALPSDVKNKENIKGVVISLSATPSLYGNKPSMVVKLQNNKEIRVPMRNGLIFKRGSEVELKKVTLSSGMNLYSFIKYLP